jgi:3-oxoacyl-[acyl-carrier protein] reductase
MDLGLSGRIAIVTGGSRGIGRACAIQLAREGANVAIVARDAAKLAEVANELEALGVDALPVSADLSTAEGSAAAVEETVARFGQVDILINNAGAAGMAPILDLPTELIDSAIGLKLYGYLRMAQLVAPGMRERGWGRIVNIAGGAGSSPSESNFPTGLANIGVLNMTRALSDAVASDGVLVNTICPGMTDTDRGRELLGAQAQRRGVSIEQQLADTGARLPAGRIAEADEIARVATFLASDACSYVHSSSIYMDGGARRGTP